MSPKSPNYTKTIICFANSRKMSGRCIAGREVQNNKVGDWIRPVSARPSGEVSEEERRFSDGTDPKLLDIIRVPMDHAQPHAYQTENHVIDGKFYWHREGSADHEQLAASLDNVTGQLWGADSTYHGQNDKVAESIANAMTESLKLVKVQDLEIHVQMEGGTFGPAKRKVRGQFTLNKTPYLLTVTDPVIERKYLSGADGTFQVGAAILCISLGEIFAGAAYKLIAGVILPTAL